MPIIYNKLFSRLKSRGYTTYKIRRDKLISEGTLQTLRNNGSVSTKTIEKLCKILKCQPGDIMEYMEDKKNKGED